jgi:serine beta-lactamase-like protein LACTB, mitochondrial
VLPSLRPIVAAVRKFVVDTMRVLGAPGAAICVRKDGRLVWSEGFGYADLEQHVPVTPQTKFRIGSVSKPLTAAALGLLSETGKLDWDAPIQRYVPTFPVKRYPITVRQVAGHLAGIRHYRPGEFENQKHYSTVSEGLTIFQNDSLLFEPGTQFAYSSYGWNLLSAVVEGASGQSFLSFMDHRVFAPSEMSHTVADFPDSIIPERARFYTRADSVGPVVNAPFVDNSYKWAGGGFLSTAEDLAQFGEQMLDGRLLHPATVALLWTPQRTRDGKATDYGIGWGVEKDAHGRSRISHSGGSVGGTANLIIYPTEHLIVVVLVNSDRTFVEAVPRYAEPFLAP